MNSQEINTLRAEVADFFTKMFDTFGHEKVKRDIEVMLLKNQKLYAVFFEWFYSEGFVQSTGDKPNNKRDVLLEQTKKNSNKFEIEVEQHVRDVRGSANERIDTKFNLEKGYKVVESRPKTTAMGLMASISEDRKDVNFDLSPSQTNSNSKHGKLHQCLIYFRATR